MDDDPILYFYKVLHIETPSISSLREDLPQGLVQMIDQLLAKTPEGRGELDLPRLRRMLYSDRELPPEVSMAAHTLSAHPSTPEVGDLLQAARAEGVDDGVGQFTLNPEPWRLDLSYQGILAEETFDALRDEAEKEMVRREIEILRRQPLNRDRAVHYMAVLRHVLQPDILDELHGRILDATMDLPADYSLSLWRDDAPDETPWERLVAGSCRHARSRRLPSLAKVSRLLTHPRYLRVQDWEKTEALGRDAFPEESENFRRFLLSAWASCEDLRPPLARVPEMLRCLAFVNPSPEWDSAVKQQLSKLLPRHTPQHEDLAPIWAKCLPRGFPQSRDWCGEANPEF